MSSMFGGSQSNKSEKILASILSTLVGLSKFVSSMFETTKTIGK